ncbi:MAG: hypothetical protein KBE65_11185 [Phycisphaerae bacterium]|nr:hypothetical protein [Phycisphaerae bacterium]
MWKWLTVGMIAFVMLTSAAQAAKDVTAPGDVIQGVPNDGVSQNDDHGWPGNEPPLQAIDNQITTKFLHFKGEDVPTGIRVTPAMGESVVTAVTFTTANDAEERDPVKYELSGSNVSIDGPYTLIASGDIKDFAGSTAWPRRTKTTTPMRFANTVAYKHYQVMFPTVRTPASANSMQVAEIELVMDVFKATAPDPADGAITLMPLFRWTKGDTAAAHNFYLGTSPELTEANLVAPGLTNTIWYHTKFPLEPGMTYYWRVDEVDASGKVYTGDVWSVLAAPQKAYSPVPQDGDKWISVGTDLTWSEGVGATSHTVYFGTDEAAVAARDASVLKGAVDVPVFSPGALVEQTTYFWAVDEKIGAATYAGPVWSFTTEGGAGGVRGDYFVGTAPQGTPVLSRIDAEINVNLTGATSPGDPVPGDGWSARWTADLEIALTGTYTFSIDCQDGTRMWVDGKLIIDQWITPTVTSSYYALPMKMEKGFHSLQVEYFDSGGDAVEQLYWAMGAADRVILPAGPLQPPVRAQVVYPATGAKNVDQNVVLKWTAGEKAAEHDVYFGEDKDAVASATPDSADVYMGRQDLAEISFDPGGLEWSKTYYWRVDEVNEAETDSPWKASVWSFTTADFIVVDDMEIYTDIEGNRIFETWVDGWTNGTKSQVGHDPSPFAESVIIHGGRQSMPFYFRNLESPFYSEASREYAKAQDWTANGMADLVLNFVGVAANTADTLYIAIEDSAAKIAVKTYSDSAALLSTIWTEWRIPLSDFAGVDPTKVKKVYIGVGNRTTPAAGGTGVIYIDDIRVVKP